VIAFLGSALALGSGPGEGPRVVSYALAEVERFMPILSSACQMATSPRSFRLLRGRKGTKKLFYHKDTEGTEFRK
jgi:hypothetical protein